MPGYKVLNNYETEDLFAQYLDGINIVTSNQFGEGVPSNPFKFHTHPETDLIIITSPLAANNFEELLPHLKNHFPGKQLLLGLTGQGATEQHIITAHVSADHQTINLYDPKASNAQRFFSGKGGPWTLVLGLLRALNPFPKTTLPLAGAKAFHHALGTQSFFDGVSCGYHNVANILACKKLIEEGNPITRNSLLNKTKNPVNEAAQRLIAISPDKVNSSFTSFIKKAWQDTVMPLQSDAQRKALKFQHYFLGWPAEGKTSQKIIYFVSLRFIVQPLINLLRRPVEFTFNALSETANFLKNSLINWAPTNLFTQYLRSGLMLLANGMQGLFKGAYLALRTITSPITTFQAIKETFNSDTKDNATAKASSSVKPTTVQDEVDEFANEKILSDSNVVRLFKAKGVSMVTPPKKGELTRNADDVADEFVNVEETPQELPNSDLQSEQEYKEETKTTTPFGTGC
ncbi:hypothetical protein [Legionella hackeliae]|uniref:Uncharacterized protein n=1 Tax=Legionella hackeliae TaxID=449 RepID=A0A0A8UZP7_LEGHA|nr:hypothetical protein [Legionella hackeliae]KTD12820.1 hypothetical protein Lhac_1691 [Legionella hackeliae]CEK12244.1 protein of unknown function [Legionella hackeliae]